jgi:hypothetical protein
MSLVFATLVVWGFSRTVDANLFHAAPPRPFLLWMHGAVFSIWVVFFIAQSGLVRVHKVSVHRLLGWFGAGLATVMVPLGVVIAIYWRKRPEFHRRLVFIATVGLMDAALGRFDYLFNYNLFYPCLDLMIVLGVVRDLVVDRHVNKVYLYALSVLIVGQSLSLYMWRIDPPWWQSITRAILG